MSFDYDSLPLAPVSEAAWSSTHSIHYDGNHANIPALELLDFAKLHPADFREPPQLVDGILHEGCKMVIGAHSKSYKSWLALQLAASVSSGRDFLGLPTTQVPVAYLNLEIMDFAMYSRVQSLQQALDLTFEEGQFHIINARGKWHGVQSLEAMVSDLNAKGVKLLFVDPIYKVLPCDENNTFEVGSLLQSLDRLVEETGAALVYVHHYKKTGRGKAMDMLSGSGVFARDFDSMIGIEWDEPDKRCVTACREGNLSFNLRNHPPKNDLRVRREHPLIVLKEGTGDPAINPPQENET